MNDIEFAYRISPQFGTLYREAKRSRHQFPKNTLILIRSLVNLGCNALAQPVDAWWSNSSLSEKIEWLAETHRINFDTRDSLHQLRRWGNAAAHPENSLCSDDEFIDMASEALETARNLLQMIFSVQQMGAVPPALEVIEEKPYELQELCYRAIMAGSASEQYQVAIALLLERKKRISHASANPGACAFDDFSQLELDGLRKRALDLLEYASTAGFPPAQYELALALLNGMRGSDKTSLALDLMTKAAQQGLADALAWRGQSALYGHHGCQVDYQAALGFLEKAATDDHPGALTLLSRMYRHGQGVPKDTFAAFALMMRAAEAGFPAAQFEVAIALRDGDGVEPDDYAALAWLRKSSDAGYADAQRLLARVIQHGELTADAGDAEQLLNSAICRSNAARLELAALLMAKGDASYLVEAASLVHECYDTALTEQDLVLVEACRTLAQAIVRGLRVPVSKASSQALNEASRSEMLPVPEGVPTPSLPRLPRRLGLAQAGIRTAIRKVGRNEPCPCGSREKYKRCCAYG